MANNFEIVLDVKRKKILYLDFLCQAGDKYKITPLIQGKDDGNVTF